MKSQEPSPLREHFRYIYEAAPLFGGASAPPPQQSAATGVQAPTSMAGDQLGPQDIRLARSVIQDVTQDLTTSGVQVGALVSHLSGEMQVQDWNDLSEAISIWIGRNHGTSGGAAQVRALQQKVRDMIGRHR